MGRYVVVAIAFCKLLKYRATFLAGLTQSHLSKAQSRRQYDVRQGFATPLGWFCVSPAILKTPVPEPPCNTKKNIRLINVPTG